MADGTTTSVESAKDFGAEPADKVRRWLAEIRSYDKMFAAWQKRSKKIIHRYRSEALDGSDANEDVGKTPRNFNILWSNIETLKPALLSKEPKVIAQRRNKDRSEVSLAASEIIQRGISQVMEDSEVMYPLLNVRDDYLLTARGEAWVRYTPEFGEEKKSDLPVTAGEEPGSYLLEDGSPVKDPSLVNIEADGQAMLPGAGEPFRPVIRERVEVDHISWSDFGHTPAPTWEKVTAVWRRDLLTRDQLIERFGEKIGNEVRLTKDVVGMAKEEITKFGDIFKRAEVYQIYCKNSRTAIWVSPGYDVGPLDELPDPLGLKNFFPCPRPMYGTTTTDTLVPVPDYAEYQSQALELDILTQRIDILSAALRITGAYDGAFPALEGILKGAENNLIPIDNWAMFAEKGGIRGSISFLPVKEVADVLQQIVLIRNQIKQDLYEITGLSDIMRGQSDPNTTATAERIKGQFGSLRLKDRQKEMSRFTLDIIRIIAEILAEQFSPENLLEMSSWMGSPNAVALDKRAQSSPPVPGPNGQLSMPEPPGPGAQEVASQALALLRDDRLRSFNISIETASTIIEDVEEEKASRIEFLKAVGGFLKSALPAAEQFPAIRPLLSEMLLFGVRAFHSGTQMEITFEDTLKDMNEGEVPQQKDAGKNAAMQAQTELASEKMQFDKEMATERFEIEKADKERAHELALRKFDLESDKLALEQKKLDDIADARTYERNNELDDRRLDGKLTPTIEDDMKEVAAALVQMGQAITMLAEQLAQNTAQSAQIAEENAENQEVMIRVLAAPRNLVHDPNTGKIIGSELDIQVPEDITVQ